MLDWMIRWSFMALAALPAYLAVAYARAALVSRAARKEYADDRTLREWEFPEEKGKVLALTSDGRLLATIDPGWSLGRSRGGVLRLWRIPAP